MVLTIDPSGDEMLNCDHSNKRYPAVLSWCAHRLLRCSQMVLSLKSCVECDHSNESYSVVPFFYPAVYIVSQRSTCFLYVNKILKCDYSLES